ncbi:macrolide-efflux transmembrane protein [Deinococcus aerius]|uniref:Macrolide-efflux transmembrane protein n=1 Tax=Deinococcus aerius TaxID=200253 RepID=A0A2I9DUQ1_9DEIO|nr:MFS transporter [Deinococcus aerius]GBF06487.1 macrolide-efflux transmembrane protein [Deinococcus aerius]
MDADVAVLSPAPTRHPDPGPGWQRRFWSIFVGQALSLTGSALTQFVLLWWITDTTGSAGALATAGMAALLPQALLGPLGGTFADRYSRRLLMIGADTVSALCMLVLIFLFATGRVELWHVYTMMFIRSSMQAFQAPAAAGSTAMLVPADFLPRAAGLNQSLQGIMTVAAAPLGALALGVMPLGAALSIDVVTALLGILPLLLFRIPQVRVPREQQAGVWAEFREGALLVWNHPGLRHLYTVLAVVVLTILPTFSLTPLLVKTHFGGGPGQVALMEGLSGAGMIAGGLAVTVFAPRRRVMTVLVAFALSCFAVALTALAPGKAFWLAVVWWVVSGVTFSFGNAPMTAVLQTVIPNQLQGRALSLLSTVMGLAGPVGLALAGPLGELIGVRGLFMVAGVLSALASLAGFLSPALLRLDEAPGVTRGGARVSSEA